MKIISKVKDYYDFLVSKWGIDPKVVYVRNGKRITDTDTYDLYVDPKKCKNWAIDKSSIFIENANGEILFAKGARRMRAIDDYTHVAVIWAGDKMYAFGIVAYKKYGKDEFVSKIEPLRDNVVKRNTRIYSSFLKRDSKAPVVYAIYNTYWGSSAIEKVENPIIINSKFAKFMNPEEVFLGIYSYISKMNEKDIKDNRTNDEKIVSNGFDKRISFRNIK